MIVEGLGGCSPAEGLAGAGVEGESDSVEGTTLEWVDWFNHKRILQPIGDISPAEHEANYYRDNSPADTAGLTQNSGLR